MVGLVDLALDFVDRSNGIGDPKILLGEFAELVKRFGFSHFIMTGLPAYGDDVEDLIVANAWPVEWTDRYREQAYFPEDPVSRYAFVGSKAFSWAEARSQFISDKRTQQIDSEARGFGLEDGFAVPMFDPNNWQAVVSLASDRPVELSRREAGVLQLAATLCHGQAAALPEIERPVVARLTPREIDVLTWMAHGKSRWETAIILKISDSTVKRHLENIHAKMKVSNTTQAVARAVHSRQVFP